MQHETFREEDTFIK